MNKQKWILLTVVFVLMGVAAGFLHYRGAHQKLGAPGVKAAPIADSPLMEIHLPERVLNYSSMPIPASAQETNMLPKDTTIVKRHYTAPDAPDGFYGISITVVMMGTDRTSIHKPEYCLSGQGWQIEKHEMKIPVAGPPAYELPAMKWTLKKSVKDQNGNMREVRGFYVFWFTAENELTGHHPFWRIMREVFLTGVLPRWSYVGYFCAFLPEQEAYASEQVKQFVAASAQEFQLPPRTNGGAVAAH
jgi:hypothetical protein